MVASGQGKPGNLGNVRNLKNDQEKSGNFLINQINEKKQSFLHN